MKDWAGQQTWALIFKNKSVFQCEENIRECSVWPECKWTLTEIYQFWRHNLLRWMTKYYFFWLLKYFLRLFFIWYIKPFQFGLFITDGFSSIKCLRGQYGAKTGDILPVYINDVRCLKVWVDHPPPNCCDFYLGWWIGSYMTLELHLKTLPGGLPCLLYPHLRRIWNMRR